MGLGLAIIALLGWQDPVPAAAPPRPKPMVSAKAESLYVAGRRELNRGSFARAAFLFGLAREESPDGPAAPKIFYWEAYARYRIRTMTSLMSAKKLALAQLRRFSNGSYAAEAEQLEAQITAEMARRGDSAALSELRKRAFQIVSRERSQRFARKPKAPARARPTTCGVGSDSGNVITLQALASIDSAGTIPLILRVFAQPDSQNGCLRQRAVYLVHRYGGVEGQGILMKIAATDPDPQVRRQAVTWLGRARDPRTTEALAGLLRRPNHSMVQQEALTALSRQRSERADEILREFAIGPRHPLPLREQAFLALADGPNPNGPFFIRSYAATKEPRLKEAILFAMGQTADGPKYLAKIALDPKEDRQRRTKAVTMICKSPAIPASQLVVLYDGIKSREAKGRVVLALADRPEPIAIAKLRSIATADTDRSIRRKASLELRKLERKTVDPVSDTETTSR